MTVKSVMYTCKHTQELGIHLSFISWSDAKLRVCHWQEADDLLKTMHF